MFQFVSIHFYTILIYIYSEQCLAGNIRLVGGETDMEGRVEVCDSYRRWGTVCNRQWTSSHTKVVCRNLGYDDTEGEFPMQLLSMTHVLREYLHI